MDDIDKQLDIKREEDIMKIAGVEGQLKAAFWRWYLNPLSPSLLNATQSALNAGFPESQAKCVSQYKWFKRSELKANMLEVSEKTLQDMLTLDTTTTKITKDGVSITSEDAALIKIKQDTAKYVTSTLGKKDYSPRTELTGKGGGSIKTQHVAIEDKEFNDILDLYANKRNNRGAEVVDPQ